MMAGLLVREQAGQTFISITEIPNERPFRFMQKQVEQVEELDGGRVGLKTIRAGFMTRIDAPDTDCPNVLLYEERY